MQKCKSILLFCLIFLILYGCAGLECPVCDKKGLKYSNNIIFRDTWFDNYNCALSLIEAQCYEKALSFINNAINKRYHDQRMAKTYGMHFIDYFPHREKGIIHFFLAQYHMAEKELQISISDEESNKSLIFLDKTRKKLFDINNVKVSKPKIILKDFENNKIYYTNNNDLIISGNALDEQFIKNMYINSNHYNNEKISETNISLKTHQDVFIEKSAKKVYFEETVSLKNQGKFEIELTAFNLRDEKSLKKFFVIVDRSGPVLKIEKFIPGSFLKIRVNDISNELSIYINKKLIKTIVNNNISKDLLLDFDISSINKIFEFSVKDKAGNETITIINNGKIQNNQYSDDETIFNNNILAAVICDKKIQNIQNIQNSASFSIFKNKLLFADMALNYLSDTSQIVPNYYNKTNYYTKNINNTIKHTQNNFKINQMPINEKTEKQIFDIKIKNFKNHEKVFFNKITLQGQVTGKKLIKSLKINDEQIISNQKNNIFFSNTIYLEPGINTINITAMDLNGLSITKNIILHRFIREIDKIEHSYSIALHPFKRCGQNIFNTSINIKKYNIDFFESLNNLNRFNILLRSELINQISTNKQKLILQKNKSNYTSDANLFGYIVPTTKGIELICKIVENTSKIDEFIDIYDDTDNRYNIKYLTDKISEKIHRRYPQVYGFIQKQDTKLLEIKPECWKPAKNTLKMNWPVIIYQELEQPGIKGKNTKIIAYSTIKGTSDNIFFLDNINKVDQNFNIFSLKNIYNNLKSEQSYIGFKIFVR